MPHDIKHFFPDDFANLRHIGPSPIEIDEMLASLGFGEIEGFIRSLLPEKLGHSEALDIGNPLSERETLARIRATAEKNVVFRSLIGAGFYGTDTPSPIIRNILESPAWYTAYTPYQSEISQGRLEVLLIFQTMVCDLTGLEVANASLLDEATACAEAMTMAYRSSKSKSKVFFVDRDCHPQNIAILRTRAEPIGIQLRIGDPKQDLRNEPCFGALFQYPGTYGAIRDFSAETGALHDAGGLAVFSADPMALMLFKEPGAMGADIAVGSAQRFGVPLGFGGPHAAFIAAKEKLKRELPGRIVGVSKDSRDKPALRLALQTREQHIRRQKAKSNICTAQVLPAVMAAMYAVFHGRAGLRTIAERIHSNACDLRDALASAGHQIGGEPIFDTFMIEVGDKKEELLRELGRERINARDIPGGKIGISVDELTDENLMEDVCKVFKAGPGTVRKGRKTRIPAEVERRTNLLTHSVFHLNRSEAAFTRFIRGLSDRDLALDRSMIPLGSCTMKLNAATEMIPVTWPEFSQIHPLAPLNQAGGFLELVEDLSRKLCQITGFDKISMQPNSGAQGEYAGLMAIRGYQSSIGQGHRNICMIPASAHGTNAASASLAGYDVVEIGTSDDGSVDLDDLAKKTEAVGDALAATMITYPSTHGVFESGIKDVIDIAHRSGGQVYLDGANLNALLGIAKPGELGADVAHLNLHKTFCIPHGGGGPGMGPIGVKSHLAEFLPGDPATGEAVGAVSGSRLGSASILVVSWAYLLLMGGEGLEQATKMAILNSNYVARRLQQKYKIRYAGRNGFVAHECIIDINAAVEGTAITVEDVAKRLIDNGFHPPTMSWPVPGTLMVEPTESEPKSELDRFCDAMIEIADEIEAVRSGNSDPANNVLVNAPHTAADLVGEWDRPYSRRRGIFPAGASEDSKYWPPVNRVDNLQGDRNFIGKLAE